MWSFLSGLMGVWRGDTRTCEQGQIILAGPVITRPINMNQVNKKSANNLNPLIETAVTDSPPIGSLVTNENETQNDNESAIQDDNVANKNSNSNSPTEISNQPIKSGVTKCHPIRLSLSSSSDSSDSSKTTTWGQVKAGSPKKTKQDSRDSDAQKSSPNTSPKKNRNDRTMTSWKNLSPTKSSSGSDLDNSCHSNKSAENGPKFFRFSSNKMKEFNESASSSDTDPGYRENLSENKIKLEQNETCNEHEKSCKCSSKNGSPCKRPGSCNCSNSCTSHLPDNQNSLVNSNTSLNENDNGSPKKERGVTGSDDMCDNDYFFEDDFTVQFDTNLKESSVTPIDSDPSTTILEFPHMVSGSYLHFNNGGSSNVSFNNSKASSNVSLNNMRVSNILNNQDGRFQYDSEFSGNSGSHNSTMEMSSSDRDMMGSSDMIELSDGPLFTPTPTHLESTDSLDKSGNEDGDTSGSDGSSEPNLNIDCCPRKEEYFLSFDGSQSRVSGSETDISLSINSHESYQGHWIQSEASVTSHDSGPVYTSQGHDASNESSEGQEESTDSFHLCFNQLSPRHRSKQYAGRENLAGRVLKKLGPVKETITETEESSEDENTRTSTTLTAGSKDVSSGSPETLPRKKMKLLAEQVAQLKGKKSGQLFLVGIGKPEEILRKAGVHSHTLPRVKKLVSWKQLKNFRKGDYSKCTSLPELNTSTSWQNISSLKCRKLSEVSQSFHGKRHSASLLEFYQRMKSQSNPVSPETMNNLEQILWPNFLEQKTKTEMSESSSSSQECTHCQCHKQNLVNGLPDSGVKGYSNKRIIDWLKMEGSGSLRPNTLGCQTGKCNEYFSKETLISPQTVTLWCGTKTVGSQFPPSTKDCCIQTLHQSQDSKESRKISGVCQKDQALQTSDFEEEEILSILSDNFDDFNFLKSNEGIAKDLLSCPDMVFIEKEFVPKIHRSKSAEGYRSRAEKHANCTNKSYQERTSQFGRSRSTGRLGVKSESPARRMGLSKHYSQQSLPDIAFLSSSISISKEESKDSLFDAMKIELPEPVTIVPKTELEQFKIYQQSSNPCLHRVHCCGSKTKKGTDAETGSSSSGISTSSASSGIDPGYCECRSRSVESPQNDLERLIFFPPHTEEKRKSTINCCVKRRAKSLPSKLSECANPLDPKVEKYANESRPQGSKGQVPCRISEKWINAGKKQGLDDVSEPLYALEEEQTPVASPEDPRCHDDGCCSDGDVKSNTSSDSGAKCNYCCGEKDFTESDFYRAIESDKIIIVANDYYRGLSVDSNSSSGSSAPNIDRKPLKSCLRKRNRGLKSRSMSATDTMTLNFDDLEEKVKNHRHSYGCDEVYIVSDEHGQLMMYQADDSAEPVMFYLGKDGECHMTEGHRNHLENFGSLANFNIQANDSIHGSDSSTEREGSNKRKSVSFASEVSFQSISPAMSPKHVTNIAAEKIHESRQNEAAAGGQEVDKTDAKDDGSVAKDDESVAKEIRPEESEQDSSQVPAETKKLDSVSVEEPGSSSSSESAPEEFHVTMDTNDNLWFEDVMMEKIELLGSITKAADVLYAHFDKSKDTFDKLRLGNTVETPELGEIVVTRLCTTLSAVLTDGLKHKLAGFQMFGSVQITVWKVVEASVEIVPQTLSLCDLVHKVKQTTYLATHQQKFDAFVFGLLNLRVLDFWMGYLRQKESQLAKFYNSGAILVHSNKALKKQYDDVVTSLQKLAVLPFHMDTDFIRQKALSDSKLKSQDMIGSSESSTSNSANQNSVSESSTNQNSLKDAPSVLELTASKALSWLANATLPRKRTSSDTDLSSSRSKSENVDPASQLTDSDSTASQISGSFSFTEELEKTPKEIFDNLDEKQKQTYRDARISSIDIDPIINQTDSLRSSQSSQSGIVSLFSNMAARLGENPTAQSLTQSMTSSASSLVTRLTGLHFGSAQKTYKKGVTEYQFSEDNETGGKSTEKDKVVAEVDKSKAVSKGVNMQERQSDDSTEDRNSKRVSFDIVNLFDKLLLPSAKPEKKEPKPVSKIPRPTNRWSWSFGLSKGNNSSPTTKLTKAATDSDIKQSPKHGANVTKNEHFPKKLTKQTEKLTKGSKPAKTVQAKVTAPPKPPRLVQSASTDNRKPVSHSPKKNTATL